MRHPLILAAVLGSFLLLHTARGAALDVAAIEAASGAKGTWIESEKVYKLSFPRDDVKIVVDGSALPPFMGLTTWASFMSGREKQAMVMGDIVVFGDEVNRAMSAALEAGLDVTALHNHFFYDHPRAFFMHIGGEGTEAQLAGGVRKILDSIKEVRAKTPQPAPSFGHEPVGGDSIISAKPLDAIFAATGTSKDGMYKFVVGREVSRPCACTAGKEMGVNTWAGFRGTDEHAIVDGDFACAYGELQPVLKSLRGSNVNIVAIHNHMEAEAPRLIFLHFWSTGRAQDLARAIKAALDIQHQEHAAPHDHQHRQE
jgi:hypothetical protein